MNGTHMSRDVARVIEILEMAGVEYRLGPLATAVKGDWDQVLTTIRHCHQALREQHPRVITTITIDDRKEEPHHLDEMISVVEKHLGHAANRPDQSNLSAQRERSLAGGFHVCRS